ncbi:DASH complex subunit dam1 [Coemansia sp. RSA 1878]|nr:DASH complex subunit dam1 [Coemansia sp. RSA 1878]
MTPPSPEPLPPIDEPAFNSNVQFQEEHDAGSAIPRSRAPAGKVSGQQKKKVVIKSGMKRRKPVFQTRKITDLLAARFRDQPHKNTIEQILKELNMNRDGMYVHEIVRDVGNLTRSKCMDYMNALVHTEAVVRINKKGHLFYLDPEKFS